MKLGYTIIHVDDVIANIEFYKEAFDLKLRFLHETNSYAEMETGETILAFASNEASDFNGLELRKNSLTESPSGFEIAFVTDNVEKSYERAIKSGAIKVSKPEEKP